MIILGRLTLKQFPSIFPFAQRFSSARLSDVSGHRDVTAKWSVRREDFRKWRCCRFLCCHLQNVFLPFGKRQGEFHLNEEVLHLIFQLQRYVDFHNCFKIFVKLERVYTPKCYVFVAKWDISGIVRYGSWKVNFILICVDRPNQPCTRFSPITDCFFILGTKSYREYFLIRRPGHTFRFVIASLCWFTRN